MIDFDKNQCSSIKSVVVKGNTAADVTSRFINEKNAVFKSFAKNLLCMI